MRKIVFVAAVLVAITACKTKKEAANKSATPQQASTTVAPAATVAAKSNKMTTESGLQYEIKQKGTGKRAKAGDIVTVHYTGKFLNDTVFDSSVKRGEPISFTLGEGQVIKGWDEGIALLQEGDKATFTIPPQIAYGARQVGPIPANSTLVFDVELISTKEAPPKPKPVPYDIANKPVQKTASGLEYIMVQEGNGIKPTPGKTVSVNYTGYFRDGKIFDSSIPRQSPITFTLGVGQVIKGWDEGIALLSIGGKAHLIIPYLQAYGEAGRGPIPPKTDLIFDVELVDVK